MRAGRWKTVVLLAVVLTPCPGRALPAEKPIQDDPLFAGTERFEQGAKEISEVNLDQNMLRMAAGFMKSEGDGEGRDLVKKMEFVYVRSYQYENEGQYKLADLEAFRSRLTGGNWSRMVKERSEKETTDVWVRTDGNGQFSELVVISAEPKELSFVHLKGHMSPEDLSHAGVRYGVPQGSMPAKAAADSAAKGRKP